MINLIKSWWRKVTSSFRKEEAIKAPEKNPSPTGKIKVIAFVVGHNESAQGAVNYLGESEFNFGNRVFPHFLANLDPYKFKAVKIIRPSGSYKSQCKFVAKELKKVGACFSFHSHFDWTSSNATGSTGLYATYMSFKKEFCEILTAKLGLKNRGVRKADNGFTMLDMTPCPSLLFEWCFGNHKHRDSEKVFNNVELCGKALAETVEEIFG